jgi:hypothetical protein
MKMTLLQIVQSVLSDMDAEEVNSLSDTTEAEQVASIVRDTYYNIISNRVIPEHKQFIKLEPLSDLQRPTHMKYGPDVQDIEKVWYDKSDNNAYEYAEVRWCEPLDFISKADAIRSNYIEVLDKSAGTHIRVSTDQAPTYYTSFDDEHLVFNSYDSSVEATLQKHKSRAYGVKVPDFDTLDDNFVPDMDHNYFPLLLNESKSVALSLLKGGPDPKIDQAARRQRARVQNNKYNTTRTRGLSKYGR